VSLALLLLALCLPGDGGLGWINAPRQHNPTTDSVVVAAIPEGDVELQLHWGKGHKSPVMLVRAGALFQWEADHLRPGRTTTARLSVRSLGAAEWELHEALSLRALPGRDQPLRFAIMADTHAWALYTGKDSLGSTAYKQMKKVFKNVREDGAFDFGTFLTDTAMTNCGAGCKAVNTPFGSTSTKDVDDLDEALVRYRMTWGEEMFGPVAREIPVITANGDHEGEQGWFTEEKISWSREAREATIPALHESYIAGPPGTLAYAFETGPALIVVIDVHSNTMRVPTVPEQWHLGQAQHAWLYDVLAGSRRPWKIVMAEHVLGGLNDPSATVWKGRGNVTATDDGTPTGTFLGEQAVVHATMLATGADLFISGHDHVAVWAEKDGIGYFIAGRAGGVPNPWADLNWYENAMDYDGDGVPEYDTGVTGSRKPGHCVVEVSEDLLRLEYIEGSTVVNDNGKLLLSFELKR
jgi:hypothetical protein